jgi:hypothetical protein
MAAASSVVLPAPFGPDHRDDLPRLQVERHAAHRLDLPVRHMQVANL